MKAVRSFRGADDFDTDNKKKGTKLPPIKKSGKERYNMYNNLDDDDDEDEIYVKRESVFDYFDDEEDE